MTEVPRPVATATIADLHDLARLALSTNAADYFDTGARDETTLRANAAAWDHWWLVPRTLIDVARVELGTVVLGQPIGLPLLVAPMAAQRLAHPDGELAVMRAATRAGCPMVVSTSTMTALETLTAVGGARAWFQLYPFADRAATLGLVDMAAAAGAAALVVTVDVPIDVDTRRRPAGGLSVPDALPFVHHPPARAIEPVLDWRYIEWLRTRTDLPLVLKGLLHPDDAVRAADVGARAVIVSNHGGRQLDGAIPTAEILPDVAAAAGDRVEILVDGGIRRGADILRALALGARAVLVGRPFLWGLAAAGEAGVDRVFAILRDELGTDAALAGVADLGAVPSDLVRRAAWGARPR